MKLLIAALAPAHEDDLPHPVLVNRIWTKQGWNAATFLPYAMLCLSVIELSGDLGWSLFSEVVNCLVFALE